MPLHYSAWHSPLGFYRELCLSAYLIKMNEVKEMTSFDWRKLSRPITLVLIAGIAIAARASLALL